MNYPLVLMRQGQLLADAKRKKESVLTASVLKIIASVTVAAHVMATAVIQGTLSLNKKSCLLQLGGGVGTSNLRLEVQSWLLI